jgi:dTDP-4-amino-4,6-dideoxygalactose transaminase
MKKKPPIISVFGSLVGKEELREVKDSFDHQWLGIGPKVRAFEADFAARLGLPGLALLDSGSNALYMAVKLLGLKAGDEVIVPSFTWIACAHAVVLGGGVPVFCDVDLDTHNVTAATVAPCITRRTRAVMVVHYGGKPVRMDEILALGQPVIEDAAHAVDSRLGGRACGGMGHLGIYSFDSVKNLVMGEGGGLTSRDPDLIARARTLRYCGIGKSGFEASANKDRWWEYNVTDFFPKMLPNDVAAGIGLAQLKRLDRNQKRRRAIWDRYQEELARLPWLVLPRGPEPDERHSYFTYCVRVIGGKRDAFAKYLYEKGIYTTLRYHPLHLNPIYGSKARLPVSEQLNEEGLSLPLHPRLSEAEVETILRAVKRFGRR